jgi:hypothetical protein
MSAALRRRVKEHWARLSDGDLDHVDGEAIRLLHILEERYGYTRRRAERELLRFLDLLSPCALRAIGSIDRTDGAFHATPARRG